MSILTYTFLLQLNYTTLLKNISSYKQPVYPLSASHTLSKGNLALRF
nr:MAG TPA: hypothetical protein [Caudoviricetes sp.]